MLTSIKRLTVVLMVLILSAAASIGILQIQTAAANAAPPPPPGRLAGSFAVENNLTNAVYTATGTAYTTASQPTFWYQADVFLTADVSGTAAVTITPQFSADNTNWSDANYVYLSNSATTSVITNTTPSLTLNADGTTYMQFALAGRYMRYKVVPGNFVTSTDRITVTLKTITKNSQ